MRDRPANCADAGDCNARGTSPASAECRRAGNTYQTAVASTLSNYGGYDAVFYSANITGGSGHQITVNFGTANYNEVAIVEISGAATSSPFDVSAFNSEAQVASDQPFSGAATTTANDIVLGYVNGVFNLGFTVGSGFTLDTTFNSTYDIIEHQRQSSPGSISAAATSSDYWRGWGDLMVAFKPGSTTTTTTALQYYHPDHLSPRVTTDSSGNVIGQQGHYPFGESWYAASTTTKYQFTSYERDTESGNDYAQARYHINRLGRFSSPDLMSGTTSDPQSLNRYGYVRNVPTSLIDPSGMSYANPCGAYADLHKADFANGIDAPGGPFADADSGEEQDFLGSCPAGPWPDPGIGGGGIDMPPDRVGCIISYQQGSMSYDDLNSCLGIGGPGEQQARGSNGGGVGGATNTATASAKPQNNPCDSIKGQGGTLSKDDRTYSFDANGALVGYSAPLNPNYVLAGAEYTVPANTRVGIALSGNDTVTISASTPAGAMPVRLGGVRGAFVTSATFSGGSFTKVNAAAALGGISFGSPYTPSQLVQDKFNSNSELVNLGSVALNAMKVAHSLINCDTIFGGGQ